MPIAQYDTPGADTWIAASNTATVECWGGGGNGGISNVKPGGGGGAGSYGRKVVTGLTVGHAYPLVVGGQDMSGNGEDTTFNIAVVVAHGGTFGGTGDPTGGPGAGGIGGATGTGEIIPGGNGGEGEDSTSGGGGGGGGANSGAAAFDGLQGASGIGGGGGFGIGGGAGGNGGDNDAPGVDGLAPGGGGGGSGSGSVARGLGSPGRVLITWETSGGGGGDPHFVGFDKKRFDYHGTPDRWYRLYKDEEVDVHGYFELAECPCLPRKATFMTKVRIFTNDTFLVVSTDKKPKQLKQVKGLTVAEARAYSLPPNLQLTYGKITDLYKWSSSRLTIIVSRILRTGYKKHVNVHFKLTDKALEGDHDGIIGQTLTKKRKKNDTFILPVEEK